MDKTTVATSDSGSRYAALDGLRVFSALAVIVYHVSMVGQYEVGGGVGKTFLFSLWQAVLLFMVISAFCMCCGYYDKMIKQKVTLEKFYKKRFSRVWLYFVILVLLDFVSSPSKEALYEVFANLTMVFGFLPKAGNMSVMGVGWFLGLIFVFYFIFPFFCFLISNKKRAWFSFAVSIVMNWVCVNYFDVAQHNILFCAMYLIGGGLIFLYKDKLKKISEKFGWLILITVLVAVAVFYLLDMSYLVSLVVCALLVIYALGDKRRILENSLMKFLSGISLEIYLSHLAVFQILSKLGVTKIFGNGLASFVLAMVMTLMGTIIFALALRFCLNKGVEIGKEMTRKLKRDKMVN